MRARLPTRQRGVFSVLFAVLAVGLIGFVGLALDLAQIYNRKVELQNLADGVALAAASKLDGTAAGVTNARTAALNTAQTFKYQYAQSVTWAEAALSFSAASDGGWLSVADATAAPAALAYARVDTSGLDPALGNLTTTFIQVVAPQAASATTVGRAVAGRTSLQIMPLAICAISNTRNGSLSHAGLAAPELREYGFRRGVGYNLLSLNPNGLTPVNYALDPIDLTSGAGNASNLTTAALTPFICSGTVLMDHLLTLPATVYVSKPFPTALVTALNARFANSGSGCSAIIAPPDTNVAQYTGAGGAWWMNAVSGQGASANTSSGDLLTVAELASIAGNTVKAGDYGPLWSFAPAVQYAAAEPAGGYTAFTKSNWAALYPVSSGAAPATNSFYPSSMAPYLTAAGLEFKSPSPATGAPKRRIMNLPLLACPVVGSGVVAATVLGIGKFLLTAAATSGGIYGEFGGLVTDSALAGSVALIQ